MERDIDLVDIIRIPRELITSHRPLRLLLDISVGPRDDILLPQHLYGAESICGGFEYRVLCVCTSAYLPLKRLIGLPVTLEIVTDRRELRLVCGIVTEASAGDSDGGLASYQIVMRDTITSWGAVRTLRPGRVSRHSWDYRMPQSAGLMSVESRTGANQGWHGNAYSACMDDYQVMMPHAGVDIEDLGHLGNIRLQRHELETKCFHGEGSVRDLCAGEYFALEGHPEIDKHPPQEREFVVTAMEIAARNNLPTALAERIERLFLRSRWMGPGLAPALTERIAKGPLRTHVQFTAVRRGIPIVAAFDARTDLPPVQMQSAIVVGPCGEEVHCDALGRVKIRFPGTRPEDHHDGWGAADNEGDSAWVRVASNWAGNGPGRDQQCGFVGLPRIGTEVLVAFMGGDPDKPVIVGQLYNGTGLPPALSTQGGLPENRYLSGLKSREVDGGRASQLRFDDTPGEISAQLASDHAATQLNLGFLTSSTNGRQATRRGLGAELRSDRQVALRGEQGVLITAEVGSPTDHPHLQRPELIRIAEGLEKIARELGERAGQPAGPELAGLLDSLRQLADGGAPIVAVSAPAGLISTSTRSTALGAGTSMDIISGGPARLSAGETASLRSVQEMSLYAHEGGVKVTAASGPVTVQAQHDQITLLAHKVLELISNTDWITIKARHGVRINGGGTELELSAGGIKGYTSGKHEVHAADHQTFPAQGRSAEFAGDRPVSRICVPCLLIAAESHSAFALPK